MSRHRSESNTLRTHRAARLGAVGLIGALAIGIATLTTSRPAFAHAELTTANPAPNSVVTTVVEKVELTFSDRVVLFGPGVVISDGTRTITTTPSISGKTVTAVLTTPIGAGTYDVTWNIESSDGHRDTASYAFSVAAGVAAPTVPGGASTTTVAPTTASTGTPTTARPGDDATTTTTTPAKQKTATARVPNWAFYAIAGLAIVLVAAAIGGIARLVRRRRQ